MMKKNKLIRCVTALLPLLFLSLWSFGQSVTVRGTVTDNTGATIVGANVVNQTTKSGTITDENGKFQLQAEPTSTLTFSFIGYISQSVVVGNKKEINVQLMLNDLQVDEVVVVGYGTQRKEAVTGSVASVKGDVMREVASPNITQALQGRIAGVEMSQTSSKPGAEMQIRIRGTRSLTASNDPLVVLDGIPFAGSIGDINPNEIKSIDILKDASATAIYGSRGANGVILVTTNRGQKGQQAKVTYNGYYGESQIFSKFDMMNGEQFAAMRAYANMPAYVNNTADEIAGTNTDWQDLFFKKGAVQSHDVGVSGGTNRGNYTFGVGYYQNEGVVPLEEYSRLSLRGSLDQEIGKLLRIGFTTNSNYNVTEGASSGGLYQVLQNNALLNPYNADGSWKRTVDMPADKGIWVYTRDVVEANKDRMLSQTKGFGSYNTIYSEVNIPGVEGLKYRVNVGLNFRMTTGGNYTGFGINSTSENNPSSAAVSNSLRTNWAIENLLTYDRVFADKHQVNVVGMYSAEETLYNRSRMTAKSVAENFQWYNLGMTDGERSILPGDQHYEKSGLLSYMGRVMYSYDSRYMISATLRSDGSSRLAPGHKWHTYPAVSVGWNVKGENFMQDATWLDNLKLRVGYGETSNQAVAPYATKGSLSTRNYNFGDAPANFLTGTYVSTNQNDYLGWEFSTTRNYGLDFSMLKNRLSGTFEYYETDTKDLLLSVDLPQTTGVNSFMDNVGETQNKGFEFSLNGTILDNLNGFTWTAGVNLYSNKNEIIALASGNLRNEGNAWFVGYPMNVIYAAKKIGLWQEGDPYMSILEPGGNVGMIKVEYLGEYYKEGDNIPSDRKVGDPVRAIDGGGKDRQIMEVDPDFQGGFNTTLGYKGFDLTVIGSFKSGGTLVSSLYGANGYLNMLSGRRGQVNVDYWTPENTDAKYPKPGGIMSGDNPKYGNTLALFDASYLKIRTITLGYNFKMKAIKDLGIQNLRVYATAQNPFVLFAPYTDETGMDPETNSYGDENAATTGLVNRRILTIGTNSPSTRNYMAGISLTF